MKVTQMKAICVFLASSALSLGCSVHGGDVANEPPKFKQDIVSFGTEVGSLAPNSIAFFLWPEGLTSQQNEDAVKTVNLASGELDELVKMRLTLGKLQTEFSTAECIARWAELEPGQRPADVVWVKQWKKAADASDTEAISACAKNQETRKQLQAKLGAAGPNRHTDLLNMIARTIDPDPNKIENWKLVAPEGSSLVIKPPVKGISPVQLTLKDFLRPGNTQSTEGQGYGKIQKAAYFPTTHLLTFAVPELSGDGKPTGHVYVFYLERGPDFMGMARFKGDMKLMKGTQVMRHGSASIQGVFTPPN